MGHSDTTKNVLNMWVIYYNPIDYPGKYVTRRFDIGKGTIQHTDDVYVAESLEAIREALPMGLVRMERSRGDPAHILESWM